MNGIPSFFTLMAACLLSVAASANAATPTRSFFTGAAGTLPSDPRQRSETYFKLPEVRELIAEMESGPVSETELLRMLEGTDATIDDLLRTRLIRRTPRGYAIGFAYFTTADMKVIHASAEKYVPSLVAAYQAQAREFDRIFNQYPAKSVPAKRLATVILAGFALNWDGLDLTKQLGYRRPQLVIGSGWKYSFFASEDDPSYSEHGFIWGSSSLFGLHDNFDTNPVDFEFSSFGDPYSDPRMNLPDVFAMPVSDMTPDVASAVSDIGTGDETYFNTRFSGVLGPSRARTIGPILFALRRQPLGADALASFIEPKDRNHLAGFLKLLLAMEYIHKQPDGRYELIAPVLDRADAPMLNEALALHRKVLREWLRRVYPRVRSQLAGITAVREGVPFESVFTQIWHEYFGLATRKMVAAGLIEDPYSSVRKHRGSVAVLWRRSIYQFDPG